MNTFKPSKHSRKNPGVRMGAGSPTGQYYVMVSGERGMSPDGWHWGTLMGRVPETIKIKGPLVPGERVQFKRLWKDKSVKWGILLDRKQMPQHAGASGMPGPGMVGFDAYSMHPGVRPIVPPATENPDYGWVPGYPVKTLTVSATAARKGLDNTPDSSKHEKNLSRLSDFMGKLPFHFDVTSGYRSAEVNKAVGGSETSQHPNGLAVDADPKGLTAREVADWLYAYRKDFPELDQVIWYTNTTHVHIGICPPGATGCVRGAPRGEFKKTTKGTNVYHTYVPDAARIESMTSRFPYRKAVSLAKVYLSQPETWAIVGLVVAGGLTTLYWVSRLVGRKD